MSYFTFQAISANATVPANLSVSARTVSADIVQLVNLTATAPFQGIPVMGILYNTPLSAPTTLSAFSAIASTTFSAFGTVFQLNNTFNNQTVAMLRTDGGTVEFTALSSGSTVALSALSSAANVAYNDSWPDLQRKVALCMI